jgi:hypothetical protein
VFFVLCRSCLFFPSSCVHPFSGFYSWRMTCVSFGNEDSGSLLQE